MCTGIQDQKLLKAETSSDCNYFVHGAAAWLLTEPGCLYTMQSGNLRFLSTVFFCAVAALAKKLGVS